MSNKKSLSISLACDGLDFNEERYASGGVSAFHSHEEAELILLLEGSIDDVRKQQTVRRVEGTLILLPAGELHAPRVYSGVRLFEIRIQPQWLQRFQYYSPLVETSLAVQDLIH